MKNYIMIILATIFATIMINTGTNVKADTSSEANFVTNSAETLTLSNLDVQEEAKYSEIASEVNVTAKTTTTSVSTTKTTSSTPVNYTVTATSNTVVTDPGNEIYKTANLLYAHAYKHFSNLKTLSVDSTFTVTLNGTVTTYRVSEVHYFKKLDSTTLVLCQNGLDDCGGKSQMSILRYASYYDANSATHPHSLALMTCAGTNDSHRLVVFADKI